LCRPYSNPAVFINLISNAIEATEESAHAAKILLRTFTTQEHEVIAQVTDNGKGLEDTEKIFDAFMTTKEKGMGIWPGRLKIYRRSPRRRPALGGEQP
jgi:nitrogen fixation/metabolism regulation signal transduction histidine kinase